MTALGVPFHYSRRNVPHQNMTRDWNKAQEIIHVAFNPCHLFIMIIIIVIIIIIYHVFFFSLNQTCNHRVEKWFAHLLVPIYG